MSRYSRRIGYVGYKTPEEALRAVKYFNKTFIRMSRIGVELARPVQDMKNSKQAGTAPTSKRVVNDGLDASQDGLKRKRGEEDGEEQGSELQEFLDVMQPKSKKRAWEHGWQDGHQKNDKTSITPTLDNLPEDASDEEYEDVPRKSKKIEHIPDLAPRQEENSNETPAQTETALEIPAPDEQVDTKDVGAQLGVSDLDWATGSAGR